MIHEIPRRTVLAGALRDRLRRRADRVRHLRAGYGRARPGGAGPRARDRAVRAAALVPPTTCPSAAVSCSPTRTWW